jgi:hypothetical protein
MPRASCRCGQVLNVPDEGDGRVICPKCGARVKVRRPGGPPAPPSPPSDGFLRFFCPCGRRLKVTAVNGPSHGKCPDCGRVVPVPKTSTVGAGHPETPTEDLDPADRAALEQWSRGHVARAGGGAVAGHDDEGTSTTDLVAQAPPPPAADRAEVGLRVCPNCGRPVHLGSESCRACGTPVPRR